MEQSGSCLRASAWLAARCLAGADTPPMRQTLHMHTNTHASNSAHAQTHLPRVKLCTHTRIKLCTHQHTHMHQTLHTHTYTYASNSVHADKHTCIKLCTHINTHMHQTLCTHIHTCIRLCRRRHTSHASHSAHTHIQKMYGFPRKHNVLGRLFWCKFLSQFVIATFFECVFARAIAFSLTRIQAQISSRVFA